MTNLQIAGWVIVYVWCIALAVRPIAFLDWVLSLFTIESLFWMLAIVTICFSVVAGLSC